MNTNREIFIKSPSGMGFALGRTIYAVSDGNASLAGISFEGIQDLLRKNTIASIFN